ncbi:AI-2E family transporter [Methanobacterium oryzae]|uniref:AI-2E family transporter n=1 Tax=Methanobacterium oryzae TaxID=69540 RepID=UPI003D2195EE
MINKLKETATSGWFIVLVLLIISFFVITPMITMVILGAIFAYAIRPISNKLLPYLKFKTLTIILAMAIVILPLILVLILIINSIVETAPAVVGLVKSTNITSINSTTIQQYPLIQQYVPLEYHSYINSLFNYLNVVLSDIARRILNYIVETVGSVPSVAFQLFIFFASTFYFAKDANKLWKYVNYAIPDEHTAFFKDLFMEIEKVVKSIFFGHFLTALIIGSMAGIGFYLLGYPYALFFGVLAGFLQLIPIIGPWPAYTVLFIYDILTGNYLRAIVVILFGAFLSGIDVYIRPKISGQYADVHPLIFILGFLCGPLIFGFVGFILGPLILGITYAAVVTLKKERELNSKNNENENDK